MTPLGLVSCNSFPSSSVLGVLIYDMGISSPDTQKSGANAQALYQVGALSHSASVTEVTHRIFEAGRFHSPSRQWNSGCRLTGESSPLGRKIKMGVNCVLLSHGRGHSGLPEDSPQG